MGYPSPEKLNLLKHKINLRHNPDSSAKWALQLSFSIHDKALITIRRNAAKYIYSFLDKAVLNVKKNPNTLGKPFEYNASKAFLKQFMHFTNYLVIYYRLYYLRYLEHFILRMPFLVSSF